MKCLQCNLLQDSYQRQQRSQNGDWNHSKMWVNIGSEDIWKQVKEGKRFNWDCLHDKRKTRPFRKGSSYTFHWVQKDTFKWVTKFMQGGWIGQRPSCYCCMAPKVNRTLNFLIKVRNVSFKLSEQVDSPALHCLSMQESNPRPLLTALTVSVPTSFTLPPTLSWCWVMNKKRSIISIRGACQTGCCQLQGSPPS